MKLIRFKTTTNPFQVTSINELVKANIVYEHEEMTLEDNSMVIFPGAETYYELVENRDLYIQTKQELNVPKLMKYSEDTITDPVSSIIYDHMNITSITSIPLETGTIYYIIRRKK